MAEELNPGSDAPAPDPAMNPGSDAPAPDPAMMEQLMKAMGGGGGSGGGEGGGGGMDMAALQAMLGGLGGGGGGLGGGPEAEMRRQAQANQAAQAEKNSGEADGGADGKAYKWEQTSKYGESEIIVRFPLATPATKKDVKVTFKAKALLVVVAGEELLSGATFGTVSVDDSTWCLVEKGAELQVLLGLALDEKWTSLLAA